ncbi:hypothetical protein F5877DRAFT_12058, partial [Lentinula edodes]
PVVGQRRLTRDEDEEDVDWSDGSVSPSPASRRNSVDVGHSNNAVNATNDSVVDDAQVRVSPMPFELPHLTWKAILRSTTCERTHTLLIDDGCPFVLIRSDVVSALGLSQRPLHRPQQMSVAMSEGSPQIFEASHYCKLALEDPSGGWSSRTVRALIVPSLCYPMVLGIPFLAHNFLVTDYAARTETLEKKKSVILELHAYFRDHPRLLCSEPVTPIDVAAAVRSRIEHLSVLDSLQKRGDDIKERFADVFGDIPHIDELPTDITCNISLKEANMTMQSRGYASPRKYREAW